QRRQHDGKQDRERDRHEDGARPVEAGGDRDAEERREQADLAAALAVGEGKRRCLLAVEVAVAGRLAVDALGHAASAGALRRRRASNARAALRAQPFRRAAAKAGTWLDGLAGRSSPWMPSKPPGRSGRSSSLSGRSPGIARPKPVAGTKP